MLTRLGRGMGTVAVSAVIAAVPVALGTSDFESYENAFFSLDR